MSLSRPWLALVLALFCLPLFVGLGRADIENDEAIYSFAVDRMLETGDWLEPKTIPNEDWAFLEKPPLKFWIVSAPIRFGLLPHNEFGIRFWDTLFGGIAFLYVFAIGCRLAGPVCGAVAVLVLFTHRPLLFEHGLRTNNMEAPLLLAYCGGVYHYMAWARAETSGARWRHVLTIGLLFVLGFMTKFVAVAFLPLVLGLATLIVADYRAALRRDWRIWAGVSALALLLVVPWFIWATLRYGWFVWQTMLAAHVYTRFTSFLDPSHVQPWHYYVTTMWARFNEGGTGGLVVAGLIVLLVQTIKRRWPDGLIVLLWAVVPVALISAGTSKIYHYVYPLLPPLALAVGYLIALALLLAPAPFRRAVLWIQTVGRTTLPGVARFLTVRPVRAVLTAISAGALLVALVTVIIGPIHLELDGTMVFKSSSLLRPMTVAILFGLLAGTIDGVRRAVATVFVASMLPLPAYRTTLQRLTQDEHPVRSALECVLKVQQRERVPVPGMYVDVPPDDLTYALYYHFRRVRPWVRAESPSAEALGPYLEDESKQRPILVLDSTYQAFMHASPDRAGVRVRAISPPMVSFPNVVLLLPGPYAACGVGERASDAGL